MPKRARVEDDPEVVTSVFDLILTAASQMGLSPERTKDLTALKSRLLADLSSNEKEISKAAKEFTLDEAIHTFGLNFSKVPSRYMSKHEWNIEMEMGTMEFSTTPCIVSLLDNYALNFDRTSEAMCRTAVDFLLNECLTVMKGNNVKIEAADEARPCTPKPFDDIKIYGEVSFAHRLLSKHTLLPSNTVINGRVDHSIGRVLRPRAKNQRKRRFYSLLLLVEAKFDGSVDQAIPQLIVYLASLRQSRIERQRKDISVYGVASDGFIFIFVKISEDGTVMLSRRFDIVTSGDMKKVLGCMKYLLANRSPASTPEKNDGEKKHCDTNEEDQSDTPLDLDDNAFMDPPDGAGDDA